MRITKHIAIAATALLFAPGLAAAQGSNAPAAPSDEIRSVVTEYREVAGTLQKIRQQAIKANPELKAKRKDFQKKVKTAMDDTGYNIAESRNRVRKLGKKLRGGDLDQAERKKVIQKLRAEQQDMRKAQRAVMQDPEIQAAGRELQQATLTAMREQNPQTDTLLDRLTELRGKLRTMQQGQAKDG